MVMELTGSDGRQTSHILIESYSLETMYLPALRNYKELILAVIEMK